MWCFKSAFAFFGCLMILNLVVPSEAMAQAKLESAKPKINWLTNDIDPEYADPNAKKGGFYRSFMLSFPMTLRFVGPDSNNSFRDAILNNHANLITIHPNTLNIIPYIATHWAYGDDNKTMYFKLNPKARWSDGKPITPEDFAYTIDFMRSKEIVAPWYNNYYSEEIEGVKVIDGHTLSVSSSKERPKEDLHLYLSLMPIPKHFYHPLGKDYVEKYNWAIPPNSGPYQISEIKKGKSITFARKKAWWAKDLRYYRNRFNIDKVTIKVIRDINIAWEHFKKGQLDAFGLTLPSYWHEKSAGEGVFKNGFVNKLWFYTDQPEASSGMWLNMDDEILKDQNVRLGLAHAMNIDKVIKQVLRGDYERLHRHYTGYGPYTNTKIKARDFDLKKADDFLKKGGWTKRGPDGIRTKGDKRLSLTVTYSFEPHTERLVVLKEEAKKAGIELTLNRMDGSAAFKSFLEKKHQIAWTGWGPGHRPAFWEHYHSVNAHKTQTNNITNTDDKELDKLIDAYREAKTGAERIALSLKIQEKVDAIAAFIPTFSVPYYRLGYWRWIKLPKVPGTKLSDSSLQSFDNDVGATGGLFWIDQAEKKKTMKALKAGKKSEPTVVIDETYKRKG
jgi:microcin C transport system substrate-binding protein